MSDTIYVNLAADDADPQLCLGSTWTNPATGYVYAYLKVLSTSANNSSAGRVFFETATDFNVSDDISGINLNEPAGIGIGTVTKGQYGWFLVDGYYAAIRKLISTAKSITAGDGLIGGNATQDGAVKAQTGGQSIEYATFGVCRATVSGLATTVTGTVRLGHKYTGHGKKV